MFEESEHRTILIIDDAPESIGILNQILMDEYRVLFALNGITGLSIAQLEKPDIILLDVSMPDMDGHQVCRELKENPDSKDIPVIFITARDKDEDQEIGFKLGAADYLTKPIRPATVKVRVQNQLQLRRSEKLIVHQALYDNLTGLPNRSLSIDRLKYAMNNDMRNNKNTAVFFLDIDNFKQINDTLGHDAGDKVLIEAARRFNHCIRKIDTVGRLSGDEFIVILPGLDKVNDAKLVAENILRVFSQPMPIADMKLVITTSIGIAFSPGDSEDCNQLLINADTAMYRSKAAGRNSYHLFNKDMNKNVKRRMTLESHLHFALEQNEMEVCYQPLIDIKSQAIIGAEALIRWTHPELGKISPDEFISLAEQSGMIENIGAFVLKQGCQQFKGLRNSANKPLSLAVNISPQQFRRGNLPEIINEILDQTGFPSEHLKIEVTEGLLLDNQKVIKQALESLRNQGICLSMDDFGTGFSSLSYLRKFPFDIIKIDQSFIREMISNPNDQALVAAAIAMAHALDMKVIAEGVETREQFEFLALKNCDLAQGYLFSRPVPFDNFKKLL